MMTIAFAFIVQHTAIEWRQVTGGEADEHSPASARRSTGERSIGVIATPAGRPVAVFLSSPGLQFLGAWRCWRCANSEVAAVPPWL